MIDIKDLMIGNHLWVPGLKPARFIMSVICIHDRSKKEVLMDNDDKWLSVDKLDPVPITAEWLETFTKKISKLYRGQYTYHKHSEDDYLLVVAPIENSDIWRIEIDAGEQSCTQCQTHLKYRHELQNFVRIHTGKDLI